jgi:hypothetical protein
LSGEGEGRFDLRILREVFDARLIECGSRFIQ